MRHPLVANTERIFLSLLRVHRCGVVCDIGSKDGTHAELFRQALPKSRVLAFEANPTNVQEIERAANLSSAGIELYPVAVSNTDGTSTFHVVTGPNERITDPRAWRGMSSLRNRVEDSNAWWHGLPVRTEEVSTVRLDSILIGVRGTVALWIDVEGVAYEVLQGAEAVLNHVRVVHVEVETEPFWRDQKVEMHVREFMEQRGFALVARGPSQPQRDLVFVQRAGARISYVLTFIIVAMLRLVLPPWRTFRRWRVQGHTTTM